MKLFIVLAAVALAQAAKLDRVYLPPNARASAGSANLLQTPRQSFKNGQAQNDFSNAPLNTNAYAQNAYSGFDGRPERAQAALERNAAILRQDNSNDGETYSYAYETENGIYAVENGVASNGVQAQGEYSYTGDDGIVYSIRYTADENGFVPQGDHIPTAPPIPEEIMKALEKNAADEAAGIYDDGSYNEAKYAAPGNNQQQYYNTNAQSVNNDDNSVVINSAARNGAAYNRNSVEKTYLPPLNRGNGNFNSRNGYNY
ncbi:unnamed protein product [Arctia plantaginis]|uniref:Uncharacterized protein n=1 Tax=Arctia plantaginis TaxID=874455 RepID=A0A8S1B0L2_ARCPL|nr:unnamed protein product [Arctia plantaginis]